MGHSTVFSTLAPLLIGMAQVYAESANLTLHALDGLCFDSQIQVLGRCIGALLLILHVLICHVDDQVYVQARDATQALTEVCETLIVLLAASTSLECEILPKAMPDCKIFYSSSVFSCHAAGARCNADLPVSEAVQALGFRLTGIDWDARVRQMGVRLSASVEKSVHSRTIRSTSYCGRENLFVTANDDLDDIVLLPGQIMQRM